MAINFRGYLFDDSGNAIQGATVQLLEQDGDQEASTTTDSNGLWYFNESDEDNYDVKITRGSSIRYIQWDDQISIKELDVRNNTAAATPAATFTNTFNAATNTVASFRSLRGTGADDDEMYIRYYMDDASSNTTEVARMTIKLTSASAASEDSEINWGVAVNGSIVDVLKISNTAGGATNMTLDVAGDLSLDADGGDIFFKDAGTTFGSATNSSGNLILKSGTTTALTFSGANLTAAGTIGSGAITSTGIVTGTGFTAGSAVLAEAELELLDGLTAGTAIASKVVTTDANIDTSGQRNLTITGELDAATLDISGNADIDGTTNLDAVDIDGNVQLDGTFTVGVDDTGYDVKLFGATASAYMLWDASADDLVFAGAAGIDLAGDIDVDGTANLDNTDIDGTFAVDGTTISLDATTSLNIDNSNTSNGVTIGTATSGMPITLGHGTSEVTVGDNLTVTGDLTVSGTTTTVSSSTLTIGDTLIKLGQAYTGAAYDQGIIFTRGDGSSSNTANRAVLWDESADEFVFALTNTEAGTTSGNVTLDDMANLHVGGLTADDTITFGSLGDGTITITAFVDEDDMSTNSATLVPTQQSVKAYVDSLGASGAITAITSLLATDIVIGEDAQTKIDFGTPNEIDFMVDNAVRLTLTSGALYPVTNNQIDLGTSSLEFKDAFFDGTVTADAFAGALTGNVTGNASGTAATVTGGTQANITAAANLVTVGTIGTGVWQGTAIASAYIAADAITGAKIADDAIDSEHYTNASIDNAHLADNAVDTAEIADNAVTLAKMASGTDGNIISYDASGNPVAIATGTDGQVLTSTGAGSPPAFEDAGGGGAWAFIASSGALSNAASVEFTGLNSSLYDHYVFWIQHIHSVEDDVWLFAHSSTAGDTGYDTTYGDYHSNGSSDAAGFYINTHGLGNAADEYGISGRFELYAPHDANNFTYGTSFITQMNTNGTVNTRVGDGSSGGARLAAEVVDAIQFKFSNGNIQSGEIVMYGLKNA